MSTGERPAKRVRQACDSCRRKKSRCPGEKPTCSYCARLNQTCTYTDEGLVGRQSIRPSASPSTPPRTTRPSMPVHDWDDASEITVGINLSPPRYLLGAADIAIAQKRRLDNLEAKMSEVLVALNDNRRDPVSNQQTSPPALQATSYSPPATVTATASLGTNPKNLLSRDTTEQVARLYLDYCHSQPLPLFVPDTFSDLLTVQNEEVVFAVCAMASRFSSDISLEHEQYQNVASCLEKARLVTMDRVKSGTIELSTLQSLCLLSWIDFYDGNTHRASLYTSLASDLCVSCNLGKLALEESQEEKLRCFWSIILLQRLHPNMSGPLHTSLDEEGLPAYPKSSQRPSLSTLPVDIAFERVSDYDDLGIVAHTIQLTDIWYKVLRYAHRRGSAGLFPPWSSKSDYSQIIASQMDNETAMPYIKHRFKVARFALRSPEELRQHRSYWSPWLFTQILYHSIICVLNHPLLLSLRLRSFRVASIPEIWLQHTDDLIAQHSQWIIHILDLLEEKSFLVSDPFLAHCIAIVATIHLQQSFGDDVNVQQVRKENFAKCLRFCERIGERWPLILDIAEKLREFKRVVSDSYLNSAASQASDKIFIDLSLFWDILESATTGEKPDLNGLSFGRSLQARARPSIAAEELNARFLPETSRITATSNSVNGGSMQQVSSVMPSILATTNGLINPANEDLNVLAQSYFAQGQDFVGNMDDWWLMGDLTQPA